MRKGLKKILLALGIGAAAAAGGAGCGDDNEGNGGVPVTFPPLAELVANPGKAEKVNDSVELDASASSAVSGTITSYTFDFGDGRGLYTETSSSAPDGAFDGKTAGTYPAQGDYSATVTVTNSAGKSDSKSASVGVGFGDYVANAVAYVSGQMNEDYMQTLNQDIDLYDPVTGEYVPFVSDIFGTDVSLGDIYIFYDWDRLNAEQQACINNRAAQGRVDPTVIVVGDDDSPLTIDGLLSAQGAKKSLPKSAEPASKAYEPVEPTEQLDVF